MDCPVRRNLTDQKAPNQFRLSSPLAPHLDRLEPNERWRLHRLPKNIE